jgi:hypothetical protein
MPDTEPTRGKAMADTIRLVDYFHLECPDKPGEGVRHLSLLKEAHINLRLFHAFPRGKKAQLDFIPEDSNAFLTVAKNNKWKVSSVKKGFLVQGDDRIGATAEVMQKLADAKINVTATTAISAGNRFGMIFWVKPRDLDKARELLGAGS